MSDLVTSMGSRMQLLYCCSFYYNSFEWARVTVAQF